MAAAAAGVVSLVFSLAALLASLRFFFCHCGFARRANTRTSNRALFIRKNRNEYSMADRHAGQIGPNSQLDGSRVRVSTGGSTAQWDCSTSGFTG